jgi:uncharacterized protein YegL
MKDEKLVHVIFCIDESGSMYGSVNDVLGGFKKTIDEQKAVKDGKCIVSLFTFSDKVKECFIGKTLDDVGELKYNPNGLTALYDGICTTVDKIGEWYNKQPETERGGKKIVVIITDGGENASKEFSLADVRKKVKTQETEFDWSFVYLGNDLSDAKDADDIGIKYRGFTTKKKFYNNYDVISTGLTAYRCAATAADATLAFDASIEKSMTALNEEYKADTGIDLTNSGDKASTTEKKFGSMDFDEFKKRFDYNQWE